MKRNNPFLKRLSLLFKKEKSLLDLVWLYNHTDNLKKKTKLLNTAREKFSNSDEIKNCDTVDYAENSFITSLDTISLSKDKEGVLSVSNVRAICWIKKWQELKSVAQTEACV